MDYTNDLYTTASQVATYLSRTLTATETSSLAFVIPTASRWIDRTLGTNFGYLDKTDNANWTSRQFKGGFNRINIDPCQSITKVEAVNVYDNSVWYTYRTPLEYIAEPYNLPVHNELVLRSNEWNGGATGWPGDDIAIKVTALFTEYDYVNNAYPNDIVLLANHISAVFLAEFQNTDVISEEQIEGHRIMKNPSDILETDPMVWRILDSRKQIWLED